MLKRLIGLLGVLFLCGCASTPQTKETIRVACVGDSITFGAGIKDWPNDCYPKQLGNLLGKGYDVRNFGVSGATMLNKGNKPYTKLRVYKDALAFNPDVVVIKLGTNDTKPNNWKFSDEYAADYVALIESFTDLKSEPEIFICKPVPVYKTRWGINDKTVVEEVIPKAEAVAKQVGANVIDLYTALSNKEAVFPDKIHPNKDGAAIIAQTVYTALTGKNISKKETSLFPGAKKLFHGFEMYDNGATKVVVPKDIADGKPWILRARFWGHEPQFDIAMLNKGYHVVYCNVANLLGSPTAVKRWDDFYNYLRFEHLFNDRVILEGMSRGGLIVYNWAAVNPDKVAAIYADAPVMDFKSWPGGKGKGPGSKGTWKHCLAAYGFTEEQAMAYTKNPIDNLAPLAKAGIPIIHVVGDVDKVVPLAENTAIAQARYKKLGGIFKVIHKPEVGHHPHSLKDPSKIVDFVIKHSQSKVTIPADKVVSAKNFTLRGDYSNSRIQFEQNRKGHVAFLGGSITEMEGYRPIVCKMLKKRFPNTEFRFTAAGIGSTCSDTGAFRMASDVLSKGPLDMLFVEFAVNDDQDGVYSRERCIRGMEGIIAQARKHNPNVDIVMTHFVNKSILSKLQKGEKPTSVQAHSDVAAQHGVSVNNLAQELADLVTADKVDWKTFGGVHPKKYGNTMCATMISNALLKVWSNPLTAEAKITPHKINSLLDSKSYGRGRFLDVSAIEMDNTWKVSVPHWKADKILGRVRTRFQQSTMVHSSTVGAKLNVSFSGTAIGAYMLSGPDTGIIRCSIDGKPPVEIDPIHKHSGFHYPQTVMFFDNLENGKHTMELEILVNRPGRLKEGGTAFRALHFTAN